MSPSVVLFDFDGTIANSQPAVIEIINRLAIDNGYMPLSPADVARFRSLSSKEAIRQARISPILLPFFVSKIRRELSQCIHQLDPIPGIAPVLTELKGQGYQLGILTSNARNNVQAFLEDNGLEEVFDLIFSGMTLFGKDKTINRFLRRHRLTKECVVYVGDETRDIVAAKRSKVKMVAVSWGYNSRSVLECNHPDCLIDEPQRLLEAIAGVCALQRV